MAPRGTLPMADEKTQKRKHKRNLMVLQSVPKKYSNRKQKKQHAKYIQGNGRLAKIMASCPRNKYSIYMKDQFFCFITGPASLNQVLDLSLQGSPKYRENCVVQSFCLAILHLENFFQCITTPIHINWVHTSHLINSYIDGLHFVNLSR